jgi:uncharacterized protein YdeI (YjbR/CyaY-like superfamily)
VELTFASKAKIDLTGRRAEEVTMDPKVDAFFRKIEKWQKESEKLRAILIECPLHEELKWGEPCYTSHKKNIVLIGAFKEYVSLLFFKGALLSDPHRLLVAPGGVQAGRQIRFTTVRQIVDLEPVLKAYVYEAIEVEQAGLKVALKKHEDYAVPEELQARLEKSAALRKAFNALTPGRQRGYFLHIAAAKQAKTRESRIDKCIPRILEGKGFNEL